MLVRSIAPAPILTRLPGPEVLLMTPETFNVLPVTFTRAGADGHPAGEVARKLFLLERPQVVEARTVQDEWFLAASVPRSARAWLRS